MKYEEALDALNRQSLVEVMAAMGYEEDHRDNTRAYYLCPFHNDHHPSFSVSLTPPEGYQYNAYMCHVCKKRGAGAVMLMQELIKRDGKTHEHLQLEAMQAVKAACKATDIAWSYEREPHHEEFADEDYCALNDRYTHHYSSTRRADFTPEALKALGLADVEEDDLSTLLHEEFSCWQLTECRYADKEGRLHRSWSTPAYPIFEFDYGTSLRKYEPLYLGKGMSYKNVFFFPVEGDQSPSPLGQPPFPAPSPLGLYGDSFLLSLLDESRRMGRDHFPDLGKMVGRVRSLSDVRRPLPDAETGKRKMQPVKALRSIVICSGQTDAINVYMRSDAHVLYTTSETSNAALTRELIDQLLWLADRVYVCYDNDPAGRKAQNALCLRRLELRPIQLPADLGGLKNLTDGRRCKDVTEFFTVYCPKHHLSPSFTFRQMLRQAKDLKFWQTRIQRHRTEEQGEYDLESKFEFDAKSMGRFLDANGFRGVWSRNAQGIETVNGYVHIGPFHSDSIHLEPQQVNVIQLSDGYDYAVNLMKGFLLTYNLTDDEAENLENALVTQRKVSDTAFRNSVTHAELDIWYWLSTPLREAERGVQWLFARNCAMRITRDGITLVPYADVPFLVNAAAVSDIEVSPLSEQEQQQLPVFEENPDYARMLASYEALVETRQKTHEEMRQETKKFTDFKRLWRFLRRPCPVPMAQRYPILQIEEQTCHYYWEKEADGMTLPPSEQQMQDIMFCNRMNNIGYWLSPSRTKAFIQTVVFCDYHSLGGGQASGGTGKSTILDFVALATALYKIKGVNMQFGEKWARNNDGFIDGMHRCEAIDDAPEKFKGTDINGQEDGIESRSLYKDTVKTPFERTPKMAITTNYMQFDVSQASTFRRVALCPVSDYFHPASNDGMMLERNYMTEFHHDPVLDASPSERNMVLWYLASCIQLHLQIGDILAIPTDEVMRGRISSAVIKDAEFNEWAQAFFSDERHFTRPLAFGELILSFYRRLNAGDPQTTVSVDTVKRSVVRNVFLHNLVAYCRFSSIQVLGMRNNDIVRGDQNADRRFAYKSAWVTPCIAGIYNLDLPRQKKQTDCLYFYRETDRIPRNSTEVLGCGEKDEESEE